MQSLLSLARAKKMTGSTYDNISAIDESERIAKSAVSEPRLINISKAMTTVTSPSAFSGTRIFGDT